MNNMYENGIHSYYVGEENEWIETWREFRGIFFRWLIILAILGFAAFEFGRDAHAEIMQHWANIRDSEYNIIGTAYEGDYVDVYGICEEEPSRSWVNVNGIYGTVSTVYIYGGTDYEYLNPGEYISNGHTNYYETEPDYSNYENYNYENEPEELGWDEIYDYDMEEESERTQAINHDYRIEISIEDQRIDVFDGNMLIISAPCVTGTNNDHDTPTGSYYVYAKQNGATLTGADYSVDVDYWMPFNGGIGIHDATWRSYFGNDIYLTNGSHGCINVDHDTAEEIYNYISEGTNVTVY